MNIGSNSVNARNFSTLDNKNTIALQRENYVIPLEEQYDDDSDLSEISPRKSIKQKRTMVSTGVKFYLKPESTFTKQEKDIISARNIPM